MTPAPDTLTDVIVAHMPDNLPDAVTGLAQQIAGQYGEHMLAVLAYGSCLRGVDPGESLIDYYVLTDGLEPVSTNPFSRWACKIVPPNVYYAEDQVGGALYRAKYAVLPISLFQSKVSRPTANPYFWARFAQPCAIVIAADDTVRQHVLEALVTASLTALDAFSPLGQPGDTPSDLWRRGFEQTYASELRSEDRGRAGHIVEANLSFYEAVTAAASECPPDDTAVWNINWPQVQLRGKLLSALRLIKAAFTFQGGADYIAWKIARHSGQKVVLTDWQRRHPILAAITLVPKLLKSGAVR